MTDDNPFHLFNTKTMSGIHPGSRTAQAHIVRWQGQNAQGWARILWPGESGDAEVFILESGHGWQEQPALRLSGTDGEKPVTELLAALTVSGRQPLVCGSCRWWQPLANLLNPDGVPLGLCSWTDDAAHIPSPGNSEQSALAMECPAWQAGEQTPAPPVAEAVQAESVGWWAGLKNHLTGKRESNRPATPVGNIAERSGVGAGTERCLACIGRIANLGALTVAAEGGDKRNDKRTLSVWRCRLCHTYYLNDWVDRWERLDSLETEESYYRIAPGEALELLALFRQTSGSEHPKERHSRGAQRAQMDAFSCGPTPASAPNQIRALRISPKNRRSILTTGIELQETAASGVALELESRPSLLVAARYDTLPFPNIGPVQEIALDLGITAKGGDVTVKGLVFQGYNGHQLLFEQRWPARIISQRTGEEDLTIGAGTGLALRSLHFILHAYEPITHLDVTAVAQPVAGGANIQAILPIPVVTHKQQSDLHFPLQGAWWAIQAGDWSDFHKSEVYSQPYAIDFVKLGADNQTYSGNGRSLTDHYSWDQPVYATAGGKVAYATFDMPDMLPGAIPDQAILRGDMRRILGNAVAISHANGEFSYYGHLQQLSLAVNEGEMVRRGTLIGRVGNSGNSPGPHLHFHVMNGPNLFIDQGLPMQFSHFWAGGQFYEEPTTIPTRMIVIGPQRSEQ